MIGRTLGDRLAPSTEGGRKMKATRHMRARQLSGLRRRARLTIGKPGHGLECARGAQEPLPRLPAVLSAVALAKVEGLAKAGGTGFPARGIVVVSRNADAPSGGLSIVAIGAWASADPRRMITG